MAEKQINPHDKFFKEVFSRKEEVQDFIRGFLPENLVRNIKFEALELDNNSYVDEKLQESFSDIVYNCIYGENEIKLTLLFEHKSQPDKDIYLQLMKYMLNIWDTNKKQTKGKDYLVPVLPIVIYHGKTSWKHKAFHQYFNNLPQELIEFIPNFSYLLKDLHKASRHEILENYHSIILQSSFLVMKDIFNTLALISNLADVFRQIYNINDEEYDKRFITALFHYLYYTNSEDNFVKLKESVKSIPNTNKDMITIAESLINQGIQKGKLEGKLEGKQETNERNACVMLLEDFDLLTIQKITCLSTQRIEELKLMVERQGSKVLDAYK